MAYESVGYPPELRRELQSKEGGDDTSLAALGVRATASEGKIALMEKAMRGDMVLVLTPATLGSSAADVAAAIGGAEAKFTRTVHVALKTAAGAVHTWFNGTFSIAGSEATVGDGTADTSAATVTMTAGEGDLTLEYIGTWAAADTATVTVTGGSLLGFTVANKTSVDTLVA